MDLPIDVAVKLSHHPNIIGIKDSGGDITKIAQLVYETKNQEFSVLAGSASFLLPALQVGAVGRSQFYVQRRQSIEFIFKVHHEFSYIETP